MFGDFTRTPNGIQKLDIRRLHEEYEKYTKIYGSVFTVWLPKPYVVITDYELVKEAFAKKAQDFLSHLSSINKDEIDLRWPLQPRRTVKEDIERALKSYSVDQEPECFVQAYYQKMQTNSHLNQENLLNVCMDFFLAGMETTSTTLRWSTLFLAAHPNVQEKMRAEILSVIGREGKPTSSERPKLPYT
ncbi:hypothetical protein TELCIR_14560, partial [Teladorsagia circumcincta]